MSSSSARPRRGGSLQFPVGRWRHVAVVDTGCGCRPRRATSRLLSQLPSFLRPSPKPPQQPPRSSSRSSSGFFPSSASTASSASAATFTTTHSSYSNYSAYSSYSAAAYTKPPASAKSTPAPPPAAAASSSRRRQQQGRRKKRYEKMGAAAAAAARQEEDDVGVAVEKESSDPRADFRESMVQMVVEMGLCGWDDLRCMLRRLLALNAPRHHAAILAAFAEVCAQLTAPPPPAAYPAYHAYDYHYHY
ncbi:unnamed protein product [Urochloa humidicola]